VRRVRSPPVTWATLVASGLGTGRVPVVAGTFASLVATLIGAGLLAASFWLLLAAAVLTTLGGVWAIRRAEVAGDPGWVTVDEFAGQFIALLGVPRLSALWLLAAFMVFRLLDISKPGPVGWADRRHGAVAIMADDVIAGLITAALLAGLGWAGPVLLD
jgi:phosphatidylglycerophosphatase A